MKHLLINLLMVLFPILIISQTTPALQSEINSLGNGDSQMNRMSGSHDVSIDIVPVNQMVVGNTVLHKLIVTNKGSFQENINVFYSPLSYSIPFGSVNISPAMSVTGNTFTTTLLNVSPGETRIFNVKYDVVIGFVNIIGETANSEAEVSIILTDEVPFDNHATLYDLPISPYLPNVKKVNEASNINVDNLDEFEWINYTVYFQNEENTTATNVRIEDEIDDNLELSTLTILDSSDSVYFNVNDRKVTFHFDDIMLPSNSSNNLESKGHISFKLKKSPHLAFGDSIQNSADIYFDTNPKSTTNTTVNKVVSFLNIDKHEKNLIDFTISPNPASDLFTIQNLPALQLNIRVTDSKGQIYINENSRNKKEITFDVSHLNSGIYFLSIGESKQKIIIQ